MSRLLVKNAEPNAEGRTVSVTRQSAGWDHVGFECFQLKTGQTVTRDTADMEYCIVVVSGHCNIRAGAESFSDLGTRASPFEGVPPDAVYVPPNASFEVHPTGDLELALCSAPGTGKYPVRRIQTDRMSMETRGIGANIRHVCNILPETEPAENLLVVEVVTPAGNWSSYPPHKHDVNDPPRETELVETYYHRLNPPQGFAFQRVYTDDRSIDETMTVENGDVVLVPRGYHPVGAAHGYDLYYLNVMAGPVRAWHFTDDPAHAWITSAK